MDEDIRKNNIEFLISNLHVTLIITENIKNRR